MADKLNQFKGTIYENGYGILAKFALRDAKLHVGPKGLYSYLTTWGNECFPGRDLICRDLNINTKTFSIYLTELKQRGYITVEQVKENGRYSHNIYTIESDLQKIIAIQKELEVKEKEFSPYSQKRNTDRKKSHRIPKNGTPNFGFPENGTTITQSANNTNFLNNTTTTDNAVVVDSLINILNDKQATLDAIEKYGVDYCSAQLKYTLKEARTSYKKYLIGALTNNWAGYLNPKSIAAAMHEQEKNKKSVAIRENLELAEQLRKKESQAALDETTATVNEPYFQKVFEKVISMKK